MLEFAIEYKVVLNAMTGNKENKLRAYEMNEQEWGLAGQLAEVLKVSFLFTKYSMLLKRHNMFVC
jgi:hypothetical protein